MKLHENIRLYKDAIRFAAQQMGLKPEYVEKDYWITYALFIIFNSEAGRDTVFKGGTALSKCYNLIEQFSEDIDLVVLRRKGETDSRLKSKLKTISKAVEPVLPEVPIEGITHKRRMNRKTAHAYNGQAPISKQNILTTDKLSETGEIYSNAENILEDLLKRKQYKHSRYIQFLAERHERNVMKLRFVLQPFSFVFLLKGEQEYHIVLETLDTEEATYIWHTDKNKAALMASIENIDRQLNVFREKGRQIYLESAPENFSKIVHDYSEDNKGFVLWKSLLEERLT